MVKATNKGHERDPRVERTEDIEAGRRTRARGGGVGAVRFEYGGGSGIGVGSGNCKQTGGYEFRWGQANEVAVLEGEVWMDVF